MMRPVLAALLLVPSVASAWGPQGHRLVARLAWIELDPAARAQVRQLLAGESDPTLHGIANWADQLREHDPDLGRRSAKWHYVNIGEHDCSYDAARDCPQDDCVVEAIRQQTRILADTSRPAAERRQALKFVVHFVGDVHQPLHAGHAHDKGGNTFQVNLHGDGSNLHRLWDSGLLNTAGLDDDAWMSRLQDLPLVVSAGEGPAAWAEASCRVVVEPGFYPAGPRIDGDYVTTWLPAAQAQLRRGGSHLAEVLNQALGAQADDQQG